MEVANGVHRLGSRYVNFYVIEERGRLTLVDAGLPAFWPLLAGELALMGRQIRDVEAVVLTHGHLDHIGIAEQVRSQANAAVWIHPADAPSMSGESLSLPPPPPTALPPFLAGYVGHVVEQGMSATLPVAIVRPLVDGEVLDVPGRPRVLHVPGHTPGSCALFLEGRDLVFTGDALITLDFISGQERPTLPPAAFNDDSDQALRSLRTLGATGARLVLPGHGEPWTAGVADAIAMAAGGSVRAAGPTRSQPRRRRPAKARPSL